MNVKEKDLVHKALTLAESVGSRVTSGYWLEESQLGQLPASKNWTDIVCGDGTFVITNSNDDNTIAYGTHKEGWKLATIPTSMACQCLCYGAGKFVTLGYRKNVGAYSTDGKNWTQMSLPASEGWDCLAYGNGLFLAVADNTMIQSNDGISWQSYTGNYPMGAYYANVLRYCNDRFIISDGGGDFYYSLDGFKWTQKNLYSDSRIYDATYGSGRYVIAGRSYVYYSTDGSNFNTVRFEESSGYEASGIAYGNGVFVITVPGDKTMRASSDALKWSIADIGSLGVSPSNVCFGEGVLVVSQESTSATNKLIYSRDGYKWSSTPGSSAVDSTGADKTTEVLNALNGIQTNTLDAAYTAGVNAYQGE